MQTGKMSVGEFKRMTELSDIGYICFDSENQKDQTLDGLDFSVKFDTIQVFLRPEVVALKSGDSTVSFSNVSLVEVKDNILGKIVTISCGNSPTDEHSYTLVCREK